MRVLSIVLALFLPAAAWAQFVPAEACDWEKYEAVERSLMLASGLEAVQRLVVYPPEASELGIEGAVYTQFVLEVEGDGKAIAPECVSGPPALCPAALDAVRAFTFNSPQLRCTRPGLKVRTTLPVRFQLPERPEASGAEVREAVKPQAVARDGAEEPEIFEVIDITPEMVGGISGLHARLEHPPGDPVEGEVMVTLIVDERGDVSDAEAPACALEAPWCAAAVRAVHTSRFTPGPARGRPYKHRITLPVVFAHPDAEIRWADLDDRISIQKIIEVRPALIGGYTEMVQRAILPPEALAHGVGGRVRVRMTVGLDGVARDLSIAYGLSRDGLTPEQADAARKIERNALDAVAGVRFEPGTRNGEPVPMQVVYALDFSH